MTDDDSHVWLLIEDTRTVDFSPQCPDPEGEPDD